MRKALGLVVLVLVACGDDDGAELETVEQEQAGELDCRPVRFPDCFNAWNDRACFYVPSECAGRAADAGAPSR